MLRDDNSMKEKLFKKWWISTLNAHPYAPCEQNANSNENLAISGPIIIN